MSAVNEVTAVGAVEAEGFQDCPSGRGLLSIASTRPEEELRCRGLLQSVLSALPL
jgi:hypothetical protein